MTLPSELVSELIEVTNDQTEIKHEAIVHGTIVEHDGTKSVKLDGSDLLTPISTTVDAKDGERVTVLIKDHKATVTGNTTAPAARDETVTELGTQVNGRIDAEFAEIDTIVAGKIEAEMAEIDELYVKEAEVETLIADKVAAEVALLEFAEIEDLDATNARVYNLEVTYATIDDVYAKKAEIESLDAKYANIDFANVEEADIDKLLARSAIIEEVTSSDGTFTRNLTAVTINGDLIEASTLKVDRLIVKGTDGNYYALSTDFSGIEGVEPVEEDAIHGSILIAESITADKISVTDLVAFGATIGGFHITDNSLYSGVKKSVDNTTRGIYQDTDGQFAVGDASNFLKFYKDADGNYKLAISAASMTFSSTGKNVEDTIQDEVNKVEVGGRNYLLGTGVDPKTYTFSGWQVYLSNANQNVTTFQVSEDLIPKMVKGQTLTLSANIQNTTDTNEVGLMLMVYTPDNANGYRQYTIMNSDGATIAPGKSGKAYITKALDTTTVTAVAVALRHNASATEESTVIIDSLKLELGNKPTDWTPAPEDVDDKVTNAQASADAANEANRNTNDEVARAHSLIRQLSDSISMLVTDENGASLMTQTADGGWTFSMAETSNAVSDMSKQLDDLQKTTGDTQATVDVLNQAVADIGATMEYVRITVYEDEPCIELGESDSDYSLMITNTRIMFRVASGVPTLINANGLVTDNIEVNNNLKQGYWVWRERKNGNLGLRWQYTGMRIITQPQNITILSAGVTVTFSIIARGIGLTYLWQYKLASGDTWKDLTSGYVSDPSWSIEDVESVDTLRQYRCLVKDKYGNTLTSDVAEIIFES